MVFLWTLLAPYNVISDWKTMHCSRRCLLENSVAENGWFSKSPCHALTSFSCCYETHVGSTGQWAVRWHVIRQLTAHKPLPCPMALSPDDIGYSKWHRYKMQDVVYASECTWATSNLLIGFPLEAPKFACYSSFVLPVHSHYQTLFWHYLI